VFLCTSKSIEVARFRLDSSTFLEILFGGIYGRFLDWFRKKLGLVKKTQKLTEDITENQKGENRLSSVQIIASFLLAFKSVLIEGAEITILSLATVNLIGKRNAILGLMTGLIGTFLSYLIISRVFLFVSGQ
jgi:uncharacterized membrane protein